MPAEADSSTALHPPLEALLPDLAAAAAASPGPAPASFWDDPGMEVEANGAEASPGDDGAVSGLEPFVEASPDSAALESADESAECTAALDTEAPTEASAEASADAPPAVEPQIELRDDQLEEQDQGDSVEPEDPILVLLEQIENRTEERLSDRLEAPATAPAEAAPVGSAPPPSPALGAPTAATAIAPSSGAAAAAAPAPAGEKPPSDVGSRCRLSASYCVSTCFPADPTRLL